MWTIYYTGKRLDQLWDYGERIMVIAGEYAYARKVLNELIDVYGNNFLMVLENGAFQHVQDA